jgi:hypothetical protein
LKWTSITSIGGEAFSYCTGLTSLNLDGNIHDILEGAFSYCNKITRINGNFDSEPQWTGNTIFEELPQAGTITNSGTHDLNTLLTYLKGKGLPSNWTIA